MREPKQLIEECKKHLRDTEQYKHEYKKDIRKLITALEKQLSIHVVSDSNIINNRCECQEYDPVDVKLCANCDGYCE